MDARAVAFHESGHAVVALAIGCAIQSLAIFPCCGDGRLGELRVFFSENKVCAAAQRALIPLAGGIAQHRACPGSPRGDDVDLRIARKAAAYLAANPQRYLARAHREAERLVTRHWQEVEIIAAALLGRRKLTGPEIDTLVGIELRWRAVV